MEKKPFKSQIISVYGISKEIYADGGVISVESALNDIECTNDECHSKGASIFDIKKIPSANGLFMVQFKSSKWCCEKFELKIEDECIRVLRERFTPDRVVVAHNHDSL